MDILEPSLIDETEFNPGTYPDDFEEGYDEEELIEDYSEENSSEALDESYEEEIKVIEEIVVPDIVKQFVTYFHKAVNERNMNSINIMYENNFNKITEKYFQKSPWPPVSSIAPLVKNDPIFLMLYQELYFRHIYSRPTLQPSLENRFASWKNYCDFFNFILNSPSDLPLVLPNQWLWDIIDEFVYQFQSFCQYRAKLKNKNINELKILHEHPQVWHVITVINYLQSLISKSSIIQLLEREKQGNTDLSDLVYSQHPIYKSLGYFSLVGLLRVHCLLGDYHLALKSISPLELSSKNAYGNILGCHISLYYYVGFTYMICRRYLDAIKTFSSILMYINRTKQFQNRSYQFDAISKKNEQMYGLLAICSSLSLSPQRIDENIHNTLREKYGEKMAKMQKGDETCFEEIFSFSCPKFVAACPPPIEKILEDPTKNPPTNYNQDPLKLQTKLFLSEIRNQAMLPTIRSYLKLYTTIGTQKLADFLELDEQSFKTLLLCYKHKSKSLMWNGGSPLNGEWTSSSDVDFSLDKDMLHINDAKVVRRIAEFFLRQNNKLLDIYTDL